MKNKINRTLLWGSCYSYVVDGMAVLVTGAILPYLMKQFNFSYNQGGLLLSLQSIANLVSSLASGVMSVYFGRKATMICGALAFVISFGGTLFAPSVFWLFLFMTIAGVGWGTLTNLANAVVSDACEGRSSTINLLHMFFAIGAFIIPFLVGFFVRVDLGWRFALMLIAVMAFLLAIVFLVMPIETPKAPKKEKQSKRFLPDIRYLVFMGILFFYVGTETAIDGWIVTYLVNLNILSLVNAQNILSLLWVAIIAGRLLCSYISRFLSKEHVVLGCGVGSMIFFVVFLLVKNPILVTVCVFGLGMFLAGIYPTTLANASYIIQGSGILSGILISGGGLGASVIPYVTGMFAGMHGIYAGMLVIIVSSTLLAVLVAVNAVAGGKMVAHKA